MLAGDKAVAVLAASLHAIANQVVSLFDTCPLYRFKFVSS